MEKPKRRVYFYGGGPFHSSLQMSWKGEKTAFIRCRLESIAQEIAAKLTKALQTLLQINIAT